MEGDSHVSYSVFGGERALGGLVEVGADGVQVGAVLLELLEEAGEGGLGGGRGGGDSVAGIGEKGVFSDKLFQEFGCRSGR